MIYGKDMKMNDTLPLMRNDCMDYREIAKELGLTVNKVKRIESQALRKLKINFPEFKIEMCEK